MTIRWAVLGMFLIIAVSGCSDEEKKKRPRAQVKKSASAKTPALEAEKIEVPSIFTIQRDDYFYNPVGKRDPFKQYIGETIKDDARPRSPLERYKLDEMVLTAIVWGIANPRALLKAPDGYSYIIRTNTRIGRNRGRVSRITKRQVFVEEEYRDPSGKLVVRERNFEIRRKKQKKSALTVEMSDG